MGVEEHRANVEDKLIAFDPRDAKSPAMGEGHDLVGLRGEVPGDSAFTEKHALRSDGLSHRS